MSAARPRLTWGKIALYVLALYIVWALRELLVRQHLIAWLGPLGAALAGAATKLLLWTVPALLLVRRYRDDMALPALFANKPEWSRVAVWVAGIVGYNLLGSLLMRRTVAMHPAFDPISLIGTVLFVGVTEEVVFRGFLLNAMLKKCKENTALAINSALFVFIHFPIWYTNGAFAAPLSLLGNCVSIFMLGLLFGYSFIKEKNLLPPILLHMVWNLAVLLWIGG